MPSYWSLDAWGWSSANLNHIINISVEVKDFETVIHNIAAFSVRLRYAFCRSLAKMMPCCLVGSKSSFMRFRICHYRGSLQWYSNESLPMFGYFHCWKCLLNMSRHGKRLLVKGKWPCFGAANQLTRLDHMIPILDAISCWQILSSKLRSHLPNLGTHIGRHCV